MSFARTSFPFLAAGLTALALPWSSASAGAEPAFSGYNSSAWAAPVKIEFYEPTIPIPADPQFEVELGYSRVEAETGLGRGRGSWLWPGDPVGEGAKTFVEQLGLPKELGERGYPVQVNSTYPTGPEQQSDEPFPGTIMRTSADAQQVVAQVGASPDGQAQEPGADDGDGGGAPETPGLPEVPGLPTADLTDFGAAITGAAEEPEPDPSGAPGMPEELAALVDFTGYTSTSTAQTGTDLVRTASRSALSDVSLVGGLITVEAVHTRLATASDGSTGSAKGAGAVGTLRIAGNAFSIGPDGIEAAGQQAPIPGLPDDPARALAELGIQLAVPKPALERSGDAATGLVQGLRVEIDTDQLHSRLAPLPLGDIIGTIPNEARELKNLLSAATGLSPRIVLTLGNSGTATDTVQAIEIPDLPAVPDAGADDGAATGATGDAGSGAAAPPSAPGAPVDSGSTPTADGNLTGAAPMGSGLPPLTSIPGALTVAGIGLAAAAGTWLRKLGLVALGGSGSCPHGLDSGLPDLRKA